MRYHRQEARRTPNASVRTYLPCRNTTRPDFRLPPLRAKHLAATPAQRQLLAEARLTAEGYQHDTRLDVWTKPGAIDCCVKDGYVMSLTPASVRHLSHCSDR